MDDVQVNYAGQRAGKTDAVNGAVFVRGASETVQCSFERGGCTDYEADELPKLGERIKAAGRERLAKK